MRVLLTGGMGFIGSHTAVSLLEAGHEPILYDNLSNADRSVVDRIGRITGHTPTFIEGDIRDGALLKQVLRNEHIFPSLKRSQPVKRPIHMVERKFTLKKSLPIFAVQTQNGALYACAISIPLGLTHQDSSVKIQTAFRTTCSPISPALRAAGCLV